MLDFGSACLWPHCCECRVRVCEVIGARCRQRMPLAALRDKKRQRDRQTDKNRQQDTKSSVTQVFQNTKTLGPCVISAALAFGRTAGSAALVFGKSLVLVVGSACLWPPYGIRRERQTLVLRTWEVSKLHSRELTYFGLKWGSECDNLDKSWHRTQMLALSMLTSNS